MGNSSELRNLKASEFTDEKFGVPTVTDIIKSWKSRAAIRVRIQNREVR
nr:transcription accessory protein [Raoultella sp. NCTC 9187]